MQHRTDRSRVNGSGTKTSLALGVPLAAAAAWIVYSNTSVPHSLPLPPAIDAQRIAVDTAGGAMRCYVAGEGAPMLLLHSINAAASAYEVRPLFEYYRRTRRVYAPDLPGFGFSERTRRTYTPRLYTDALHQVLEHIDGEASGEPVDALALSLTSEFLARAAFEQPRRLRTIALVTPTGFGKTERFYGPIGSTRGNPTLQRALEFDLWRRPFFDLLTSRPSIRYFLGQAFGSLAAVDAGLEEYSYVTAHQPDAEYAPYSFLSGQLFSADIDRIYESLALPVWLGYGALNRLSDFDDVDPVRDRSNWIIQPFEAGGLPQFDQHAAFVAAYDAFLAQ